MTFPAVVGLSLKFAERIVDPFGGWKAEQTRYAIWSVVGPDREEEHPTAVTSVMAAAATTLAMWRTTVRAVTESTFATPYIVFDLRWQGLG